ncbi:hypothetical protein TOPH_01005 [Tolypocladium ophioglossoides CBS 100239]|uniref:Uncharacterized protein n=1 Tax=Tolypocladium ophioglossoides (strain CBS 100239) TaxID=1163406 RepID=A0A0L0NKU6_TOLOC|nr:hypothetical protein TOPH_01005 [Tolypocladium ophioglossoides CBS 100239]
MAMLRFGRPALLSLSGLQTSKHASPWNQN